MYKAIFIWYVKEEAYVIECLLEVTVVYFNTFLLAVFVHILPCMFVPEEECMLGSQMLCTKSLFSKYIFVFCTLECFFFPLPSCFVNTFVSALGLC